MFSREFLNVLVSSTICITSSFAQPVNFHEHIAPIIHQKCTPCHQNGHIGPMPLSTYNEVATYGKMIAYVTESGYMPPWMAEKGHSRFENEKHLDSFELKQIKTWLAHDMPEGNPNLEVPFQSNPLLQIDNPDLVVSMDQAFEQYGVYYDNYRVFVLPVHNEEDKYISAIEFVPGNKSIVRGANISIDTSAQVNALDEWDPQYGYFSFGELGFVPAESRWYNWYPEKGATIFPKGKTKRLPPNANLILHVHYGPSGTSQRDSSSIRLKFSNKPNENIIYSAPLLHPYNMTNERFVIEADKTVRYHAKFSVPFDMELFSIYPHSHLLGKSWEIFTKDPKSSSAKTLLKINDWDFNWKQAFALEEKIILKKGTEVHALAAYDNSSEHLLNPSDPPRTMEWGKRMFEEMFLVYFEFAKIQNKLPHSFRFLPAVINQTSRDRILHFENNKRGLFSCQLKSFDGKVVQNVFKDMQYKKGIHEFKFNLNEVAFGNYYLELKHKQERTHQLLVYFDQELFQ